MRVVSRSSWPTLSLFWNIFMAQKEELAASASLRSSNRGPCLSSPAGQIDGVIYCTPVILYMDPDKTYHFYKSGSLIGTKNLCCHKCCGAGTFWSEPELVGRSGSTLEKQKRF